MPPRALSGLVASLVQITKPSGAGSPAAIPSVKGLSLSCAATGVARRKGTPATRSPALAAPLSRLRRSRLNRLDARAMTSRVDVSAHVTRPSRRLRDRSGGGRCRQTSPLRLHRLVELEAFLRLELLMHHRVHRRDHRLGRVGLEDV